MNKHYMLSLVLSVGCMHNAWGMEGNDQIEEKEIDTHDNVIQQHQVEVNTVFSSLGEGTVNVAYKILRKVQKNSGYLSVASESKEEHQNRLNNFSHIKNLEQLSVDAKKGGFMSKEPSLFKQINDRVHENNRQAQSTLVYMFDNKSLDVRLLNLSKQYIDNSKAYSEALHILLDSAYNEKFVEIQKSINIENKDLDKDEK